MGILKKYLLVRFLFIGGQYPIHIVFPVSRSFHFKIPEEESYGSSHFNIYPEPRRVHPLYINEPELIDESIIFLKGHEPKDNIRIYVSLDLNKEAILRRLNRIRAKYNKVDWRNESAIFVEVTKLIKQIEIYDQVHFVRNIAGLNGHSVEARELVIEFIKELEGINSVSHTFPYMIIEELKTGFDL